MDPDLERKLASRRALEKKDGEKEHDPAATEQKDKANDRKGAAAAQPFKRSEKQVETLSSSSATPLLEAETKKQETPGFEAESTAAAEVEKGKAKKKNKKKKASADAAERQEEEALARD